MTLSPKNDKIITMNDLIKITRTAVFFIYKTALKFINHFLEMMKDPQDNAKQLVIAIGIILVTLAVAVTSIYILWPGRKNSTDIPVDDGFPADGNLKIRKRIGGEKR